MPPRTTIWTLDDHTRGKHLVLKSYMDAWLPIMLSQYKRVLFVDAFAGPGQYKNGEPGSPVIAMRTLADHVHHKVMKGQIDYMFIEDNPERFSCLEEIVKIERIKSPSFCQVRTFNDTYETVFPELVNVIESDSTVPAFVMIDPFGVSGVFMNHIKTLMEYPSTEVYISFMYREINRFASQPEFTEHLDKLFGCSDWQQVSDSEDSTNRRRLFHKIYENQLRKMGAKYVLTFELYSGNRHVYTLFFATQNSQGCDKMKQAMWKVAPLGDFRFKGGMDLQLTLGPEVLDFSPLKDDLRNEFSLNEYVSIESIDQFMRSDKTAFHTNHHRKILADMEREGMLEVKDGTRVRKGGFPRGTVLRFVNPPPPPPRQTSMLF